MSSDKLSEKEKIKVMEKELGLVLAKQICQARTDKEWTQQQVADAVFISLRWYQYIENEGFLPEARVLIALVLLLDLDMEIFREHCKLGELKKAASAAKRKHKK